MKNTQHTNTTTYYHLIVDKSGSMSDSVDVTISTINEQLQTIRRLSVDHPDQRIFTGITLFDTEMEPLYFCEGIDSITLLTHEDYQIGGLTALLDAVGQTILALDAKVQKEVREDRASVVFIVLTDGYENSSKRFTYKQIESMIKEQEHTGNWTFTYLGADLSDVSDAKKMGFSGADTRVFGKIDLAKYSLNMAESMESYVAEKSERGVARREFLRDGKERRDDLFENDIFNQLFEKGAPSAVDAGLLTRGC